MPPLIHTMRHCLLQAQFFFREADFLFISIPQCPNPYQIPHPSTRLNLFNLLGLLSLLSLSTPKKRNIPFWYCPLCTPSLTLPPSSLKCLQKSNPGIHIKCFRCFKCFGCFRCFMFAFGPENRPVLVQIRTNPKNRNYSAMQ